METKIKSFTDFDAWKEGHKLVLMIYEITKELPKVESFGLVSQMRRCAVSITSNLSEGFCRNTAKDKTQFYHISRGSLSELQNQLIICRDVKYIDLETFNEIVDQIIKISKITFGLIKKLK